MNKYLFYIKSGRWCYKTRKYKDNGRINNTYNSIANSVRLVDVMRQVTKSISGLQINAPRFEVLGVLR
jgi:hypothetical protein